MKGSSKDWWYVWWLQDGGERERKSRLFARDRNPSAGKTKKQAEKTLSVEQKPPSVNTNPTGSDSCFNEVSLWVILFVNLTTLSQVGLIPFWRDCGSVLFCSCCKRHEHGRVFLNDVLVALLHQNLLTQQPGLRRKFLWSHDCIRKTLKDYLQYMEIVLTSGCARKTLYQSVEHFFWCVLDHASLW